MKEDWILIDEYKNGSVSAFETIYKKYASKMKGIAFRYLNDSFMAEDVVQESFIKVFKKINEIQKTGAFEAWLRRVVVNTAINYYNTIKKTGEKKAEFTLFEISENNNNDDFDDSENYSLDELTKAVNMLPAGYKMVFNMYAIDQYSHKEIAEALNINEGTSKSQLFKARAFLKEILQKKKVIQND